MSDDARIAKLDERIGELATERDAYLEDIAVVGDICSAAGVTEDGSVVDRVRILADRRPLQVVAETALRERVEHLTAELARTRSELVATETARDNAVMQARTWAQEARTQHSIVSDILRALGLPGHDWEATTLVSLHTEQLQASAEAWKQLCIDLRWGLLKWAQDCDGVHYLAVDAYDRASVALGLPPTKDDDHG